VPPRVWLYLGPLVDFTGFPILSSEATPAFTAPFRCCSRFLFALLVTHIPFCAPMLSSVGFEALRAHAFWLFWSCLVSAAGCCRAVLLLPAGSPGPFEPFSVLSYSLRDIPVARFLAASTLTPLRFVFPLMSPSLPGRVVDRLVSRILGWLFLLLPWCFAAPVPWYG